MLASAVMAGLFFLVLPAIWLGVFGSSGLGAASGAGLAHLLGPTFLPLFGGLAKSAAIWFLVLNMFHGTLQPLAGASRTLSQLSEDGLLPRLVGRRNRYDAPHVAIALTAGMAIAFLLVGDPLWMIAAANFTYLISIALPSVAVWLLRRDAPDRERLWRAPRGTIMLGVIAAVVWLIATMLGFRQFGMPVVLSGLALAYSGSLFYLWRRFTDLRQLAPGGQDPQPARQAHRRDARRDGPRRRRLPPRRHLGGPRQPGASSRPRGHLRRGRARLDRRGPRTARHDRAFGHPGRRCGQSSCPSEP